MNDAFYICQEGFNKDYLYYDAFNRDNSDCSFFQKRLKAPDGTLLELGCGTGRILCSLVQNFSRLIGIDCSEKMLNVAKSKLASSAGKSIELTLGNMTNFSLSEKIDVVLCAYNSLQHIVDAKDLDSFLGSVQNVMKKDGRLWLSVFNPNFEFLRNSDGEVYKDSFVDEKSGVSMALYEEHQYDSLSQINYVTYIYYLLDNEMPKKEILRWTFPMRQYFPQELDYILLKNGYNIVRKYGDYSGGDFSGNSNYQILECETI